MSVSRRSLSRLHSPTTFQSRPRQGINNITSGTLRDVRTLGKEGRLKEALRILDQRGVRADSNTYACLLQGCIIRKALVEGKQVHAHIIGTEFKPNIFVENTLLNMYAKCGSMVDARQVFEEMPQRDIFSWTMIMAGYAKHGQSEDAFKIYEQMHWEGVTPDRVTYTIVLNACASLGALEKGKFVHANIIKTGVAPDLILENTLVDMYAKCGSVKDACLVFNNMVERDVVSWNTVIAGYAQCGQSEEALKFYQQMQWEGVTPDKVTLICVINACACLGSVERGKQVHADIINAGVALDIHLETSLVDMYAKCGSLRDAREVFDHMVERNVVSWSAMLTGYAHCGCGREAFELYEQMQLQGVTPNAVTFISILNACASLGARDKAKQVHGEIIKAGVPSHINLENTLVYMYAKCGSVPDARQVFDNIAKRDVVSWNSMITGYAQHGYGKEALRLFEQMKHEGLTPNGITFTSVLSACGHVGLVDEGHHYFNSMTRDHGLKPTVEHFGCMVDLLGRAGRLDEAEELIMKMPMRPDASVWVSLLGACRIHGGVEVAERAATCMLRWDSHHPAAYVLLSNIYAAAGRWDDAAKVRNMMEDRGGL